MLSYPDNVGVQWFWRVGLLKAPPCIKSNWCPRLRISTTGTQIARCVSVILVCGCACVVCVCVRVCVLNSNAHLTTMPYCSNCAVGFFKAQSGLDLKLLV